MTHKVMKSEIIFMRRTAKIAGNTRCWIGIGCVIAKSGKILVEAWNETLPGEEFCQEFRKHKIEKGPALRFENVRGSKFPLLLNPFWSRGRNTTHPPAAAAPTGGGVAGGGAV